MTKQVLRRISRPIEITSHGTTQITKTDLERHARGTLVAACEVVADPRDVTREGGVDAASGDEDARVDEAGEAADCGSRDGDDEADEDQAHRHEDVGPAGLAALRGAVGEPADDDGEDGRGDVDRHGEKLSGGGFVAELFDDAGQEERDAVEWADDSPVHEEREVELPVGECYFLVNWSSQ